MEAVDASSCSVGSVGRGPTLAGPAAGGGARATPTASRAVHRGRGDGVSVARASPDLGDERLGHESRGGWPERGSRWRSEEPTAARCFSPMIPMASLQNKGEE